MKNCPYCSNPMGDYEVQCMICGYNQKYRQFNQAYTQHINQPQQSQQYQQNYTQRNYNASQQQNPQQHYYQPGTHQNMYYQQYQQPQYYSYELQNQTSSNDHQNDTYNSTSNTKSSKNKKQRLFYKRRCCAVPLLLITRWGIRHYRRRTLAEYYLNAHTYRILSESFSSVTLSAPKDIKFKVIVTYKSKKVKRKTLLL